MKNNMNKANFSGIIAGIAAAVIGIVLVTVGALNYTVNPDSTSINGKDPMFVLIFVGIMLAGTGCLVIIENLKMNRKEDTVTPGNKRKNDTLILAEQALFAALAFVLFSYAKIDIPIGEGKSAFHLGNAIVVLAALFLGGVKGGLAGAVGLTLADFIGGYPTSAPKTFILKLMIGLIVGLVAHGIFKISRTNDKKKALFGMIVASVSGLLFNCVADPIVGYVYKYYLFGIPQNIASTLAKVSAVTTIVNAVLSECAVIVLYSALRPVLKKTGLISEI